MVMVKVRETYDLHTVRNKMTVIGIHTPKPDIIKKNYPGLLMQCRAWRPSHCDVRIACASVLPLDPRGVGTGVDDVAPEDMFNPILYKAMSNKGMSQLEARINALSSAEKDIDGSGAFVDVDSVSDQADEFNLYYGLLADTNGWKHAAPQSGLSMSKLRPLVYEMVYNVGDSRAVNNPNQFGAPAQDGHALGAYAQAILGKSKEHPFIPCTVYDSAGPQPPVGGGTTGTDAGFPDNNLNAERTVPWIPVFCGAVIIPPSRLHELFYRMVIEWTIEFTSIRSLVEITDFPYGLSHVGSYTHFQNYSYSSAKEAVTGTSDTILDNDSCMVSANVEVDKVM